MENNVLIIEAAYIQGNFGVGVLSIIEELTDDKSLPRQNRKLLLIQHVILK